MALPAWYPAAWLTLSDVQARIAYDFRHTLRTGAGAWSPTTEQTAAIEDALVQAYDFWRQFWAGKNISSTEIDAWDVRDVYQYRLVMCYLGRSEFFHSDPNFSAWPAKFCDEVAAYIDGDPTAYDETDGTPLDESDTVKSTRKQPRFTNRNGLLGASHDREHDYNAATVARHSTLPPFGRSSNTRRS